MGRPLKMTETVDGQLKVGALGDTSQSGTQIQFTGFVDGGSAGVGYASRQTGSKTFKITTGDGTQDLLLIADEDGNLVAGECNLELTDSEGNTYFASKISANHVTIGLVVDGTQFSVGDKVPWVYSSPVLDESVSVPNA